MSLNIGIRSCVEVPVATPLLATRFGVAMNLEDAEKAHIIAQAAIAATCRIAQQRDGVEILHVEPRGTKIL